MVTQEKKSFEDRLKERLFIGTFGAIPQPHQSFSGGYRTIGSIGFNGEKNYGEIGPIKSYYPDYESLRARSWQLYLESEVAQIVLNKYITWVIGSGLKLQSEPVREYLKEQGISVNSEKFSKSVETQFRLYSKSRMSDYSDMNNLNILEAEAFKNAIIGGDVLVILRFIEGTVKVQLIDGQHVQSPQFGTEYYPSEIGNGRRIVHGIEIDERGTHMAYYVRKDYRTFEFERIPARGADSNALMAFMVYGSKYRLDNHRGLPLLSVLFETAKKLERYKEATVGSAEERQKITFAIEHDAYSTGENPFLRQSVVARNIEMQRQDGFVPIDSFGTQIADKIAVTSNKAAYNMPLGAHLKALESKNELYFKEFYTTNLMVFCAGAGIPYEVAMSAYNSNYSASRGAIKDWEHMLNTRRANFSFQFMQPVYDFWLETRIFMKKIKAPGYIMARLLDDRMALEAFRNARFVGAPVPHIDPVKEVEAERLKLGLAGGTVPLTTLEQATENLGGGDSLANLEQFAIELKKSKSLGIKADQPPLGGKPKPKPVNQ